MEKTFYTLWGKHSSFLLCLLVFKPPLPAGSIVFICLSYPQSFYFPVSVTPCYLSWYFFVFMPDALYETTWAVPYSICLPSVIFCASMSSPQCLPTSQVSASFALKARSITHRNSHGSALNATALWLNSHLSPACPNLKPVFFLVQ